MDNHLHTTMNTDTVALETRKACAKALLSSPNSQYRSSAYWFLNKGICKNGICYTVSRWQ